MEKKLIFKKLTKKRFLPTHVAEIGVYHPETSNVYDYIKRGIKCTLVEPDPESIQLIKAHFSNYKNVTLYPIAVYDYSGQIELVQRNASTFVYNLKNSPAIINDNYKYNESDKFVVNSKTFDEIDDGTIDLLSVDIEGSEWFVIKHMISLPTIISLETHGAIYINPFLNEILEWMKSNNYKIWYKTGSDTVFVKNDKIKIGIWDKLRLKITNFCLLLRKFRKKLNKKLMPPYVGKG